MEDLTYPHELIELSKYISKEIINSKERREDVKTLASFFNKRDLKLNKTADPIVPLIASYGNNKIQKRWLHIYQKKLDNYTSETLRIKTEDAFSALNRFIKESILPYFLIDRLRTGVDYSKLKEISTAFQKAESDIDIFLRLVKLYEDRNYASTVGELGSLLDKLSKRDPEYQINSIIISFRFSDSKYKNEFLIKHYEYLKKFYENYIRNSSLMKNYLNAVFNNKKFRISDDALVSLLKLSICLYACGYEKTLRLPALEQLNYLKSTVGEATLEDFINKNPEIDKVYLDLFKTNVTLRMAFVIGVLITIVVTAVFAYLFEIGLLSTQPLAYIPLLVGAILDVFGLLIPVYQKLVNIKQNIISDLKRR